MVSFPRGFSDDLRVISPGRKCLLPPLLCQQRATVFALLAQWGLGGSLSRILLCAQRSICVSPLILSGTTMTLTGDGRLSTKSWLCWCNGSVVMASVFPMCAMGGLNYA